MKTDKNKKTFQKPNILRKKVEKNSKKNASKKNASKTSERSTGYNLLLDSEFFIQPTETVHKTVPEQYEACSSTLPLIPPSALQELACDNISEISDYNFSIKDNVNGIQKHMNSEDNSNQDLNIDTFFNASKKNNSPHQDGQEEPDDADGTESMLILAESELNFINDNNSDLVSDVAPYLCEDSHQPAPFSFFTSLKHKPPPTKSLPPPKKARPPPTKTPPHPTKTQPHPTKTQPHPTKTQPHPTKTQPPRTEISPSLTEIPCPLIPQLTEISPQLTENSPPITEIPSPLSEIPPPLTNLPPPLTKIPFPITKFSPRLTKIPPFLTKVPPLTKIKPPIIKIKPPLTKIKPPLTKIKPQPIKIPPTKVPHPPTNSPPTPTKTSLKIPPSPTKTPPSPPTPTKTAPPHAKTPPPPTKAPLPPTKAPLPPTKAPLPPTKVPLPPTKAPLPPTKAPIPPTKAPLPPTKAPLPPTKAPLPPTKAPLPPTKAPLPPTKAPLPPTKAPIPPTKAPLPPTKAPLPPTKAPLSPTKAPLPPTKAPLPPTKAPLPPTKAPLPPTKTKKYKCHRSECNKEFNDEFRLQKHFKTHNELYEEPIFKPVRQLTTECPVKNITSGAEEPCGKTFLIRELLIKHLNEDHKPDDANYKCDECGRRFFWPSSLRAHSRAHWRRTESTGPSFACAFTGCGRTFRQPCRLREHVRSHTGDRPYRCQHPNCDWSFRSASKLVRHERQHTNERRHSCNSCGRGFLRREHLRDHHARYHAQLRRPHACTHKGCELSFNNMSTLYMHMKKVHKSKKHDIPETATECTTAATDSSTSVVTITQNENVLLINLGVTPIFTTEPLADVAATCIEVDQSTNGEEPDEGRAARTHCTWPLQRADSPAMPDEDFVVQSENSESTDYTVRSDLFLHGNVLINDETEHTEAGETAETSASLDTDLGLLNAHPTVDLMQEELMYTDVENDESSFRVFLLSGEELV